MAFIVGHAPNIVYTLPQRKGIARTYVYHCPTHYNCNQRRAFLVKWSYYVLSWYVCSLAQTTPLLALITIIINLSASYHDIAWLRAYFSIQESKGRTSYWDKCITACCTYPINRQREWEAVSCGSSGKKVCICVCVRKREREEVKHTLSIHTVSLAQENSRSSWK